MFVGHYGPSFAGYAAGRKIPLWILFLAVQMLDVLWSIFVLLGIEKVRIVPGITAVNPLDLYYMPYTHGLMTAILWSLLMGAVYRVWRHSDGVAAAGIVGAAVFSHWILDLLVHRPDLPLLGNGFKVGLGLWDYPAPASALEIIFLFGGLYLYWKTTEPVTRAGRYAMIVFAFLMLAVQEVVFFGPPPPSDYAAAITALMSYFLFAAVAYWLEKKRGSRDASPTGF